MRNKGKVMFRLFMDGKAVHEQELEKGCDPVEIGRSGSCGICTPTEDRAVSGKHARIFWKGSSLFVEDAGSRNGVFFKGEKIEKPTKVDFRMPFTIGRCQLMFSPVEKRKKKVQNRFWQIEFLNGDRRGDVVAIKPAEGKNEFSIGKDAENDLSINDDAISRRHARILIKPDGSHWICDNSSRNGTLVNGERLVPDRERFLVKDDVFSLAYLRFQYRDPEWKPKRLWFKVVVAVVTLLLLIAGYQFYSSIFVAQPSEYVAIAEAAASREQFADALAYAQKAVEVATGADKLLAEGCLDAVKRQKRTYSDWRQAVGWLQKGELNRARAVLDGIIGEGTAANWGWNKGLKESARLAHDEAVFCKAFFDILGSPRTDLERAGQGSESRSFIVGRIAAIDKYFAIHSNRLARLQYMDASAKMLRKHRVGLQTILDGIRAVDQALANVKIGLEAREVSDFALVVARLEAVAAEKNLPAGVQNYAKDLLPVCRRFCDVQRFLKQEKEKICDMDFDGVRAQKNLLPVPGNDECALHNTLSNAREAFMKIHENYQHVVSIIAPMVRNLDSIGIRNNEKGHVLTFVTDEAVWTKALSFDCFEAKFPLASRIDPTCTYDELLGIEYTYENLRELPKPLGRKNAVLMNFVPKCQSAKAAFDQVKTFQKMMERPESVAFKAGKLGALYVLAAQILADRDGVVMMLKKLSEAKRAEGRDRSKIVAGYYAEYFSDDPSYADLRALEMAFKNLQKKVSAMNERYDGESDPEKRLKIKKEIIAVGIPGMEAVRRVWVDAE